jgi:serine/threonine protein kinase
MGAEVLKKFGRYFLLDMIAQGGMAEIYRARLAGRDGAGRILVIKRIQAGFGGHEEFLQMFQSEIKVTMGFNHPNIVQLYDFGEEQGQPYIAMEFVDGKNVRQLMSRFNELKQPFPIELAAHIIEQSASGLHYAHSFRDKISGEPLNVVHRDISPQNIIVSFEGTVKVIDFGIAKATTNSEATRAGVIKGKPSYLSPEQISGEVLDGRSDVFALGICLWELLCGRKLFAGENDLAVLKLIESCQTHVKIPSTINPKVPKELDYIVLKSLAKHREKRYQTAEEFQRALHKFVYAYHPEFNPSDLSFYAKDLFKEEIVEDRKRIQKLNEKAEVLLQQADAPPAAKADGPSATPSASSDEATTVVNRSSARAPLPNDTLLAAEDERTGAALQLDHAAAGLKPPVASPPSSPRPKNFSVSTPSPPSASSTVKAAPPPLGTPGQSGRIQSAPPVGAPPIELQRVPGQSSQVYRSPSTQTGLHRGSEDSKQSSGKNSLSGKAALALLAAGIAAVAAFGPQFGISIPYLSPLLSDQLSLDNAEKRQATTPADASHARPEGREPAEAIQPPPPAAPAQPPSTGTGRLATLRLQFGMGAHGATVKVNQKVVTSDQPTLQLPMDSPLELTAEREGYRSLRREFVIDSRQVGDSNEMSMEVALEPLRFGFLTLRTVPSADAFFSIDGREITKRTPLENEKFPVGTYEVRLVNELLGMEKRITLQIQEGKVATLPDERLELKR